MCPEISSILCQSEATVGLSLQFPGERKNAFTLQEFQGPLKLLVLALLLPPENLQRSTISPRNRRFLLLLLPYSH